MKNGTSLVPLTPGTAPSEQVLGCSRMEVPRKGRWGVAPGSAVPSSPPLRLQALCLAHFAVKPEQEAFVCWCSSNDGHGKELELGWQSAQRSPMMWNSWPGRASGQQQNRQDPEGLGGYKPLTPAGCYLSIALPI